MSFFSLSKRLRASKLSMLKLIELVILWVCWTIHFAFSFYLNLYIWHFLGITFLKEGVANYHVLKPNVLQKIRNNTFC